MKKRICITVDGNTESKIKQFMEFKKKEIPELEGKVNRSWSVCYMIDEFMKSLRD